MPGVFGFKSKLLPVQRVVSFPKLKFKGLEIVTSILEESMAVL